MIAIVAFLGVLGAAQDPAFSQEPKLEKVITATAEAEAVGEFIKRIGEETNVVLSASTEVADDVIILYAKAPAKEILERIAVHFDWTWTKDEDGYVLSQSRAQKREEDDAREELILRPYLRWQKRATDVLNSKGGNQRDLKTLVVQNRVHLESYESEYISGDSVQRRTWGDKRNELTSKISQLARELSPMWFVPDQIVASLTKKDMLELERTSKLVFASPNTSWQRPFNSGAFNATSELLREWSAVHRSQLQGPERDFFQALKWPYAFSENAVEPASVRVVFKKGSNQILPHDRRFPAETTLSLQAKDGSLITERWLSDSSDRSADDAESTLEQRARDRFDELLSVSTQLKKANEVSETGFLKGSTLNEFLTTNTKVHPYAGTARLIVELSKTAGLNIISDCYQTRYWSGQRALSLTSFRTALDYLTKLTMSNWTSESDWVLVRSVYWQHNRAETLPASLLYSVRDLKLSKPYSIDAMASVVTSLSDRQLRERFTQTRLLRDWGDAIYKFDAKGIWALRFWGSLAVVQKNRMLDGETLRFGSLSASQKDLVRTFVYLFDESDYGTELTVIEQRTGLEQNDADWLNSAWPGWNEDRGRIDYEPTSQLPNGVPLDARIGMRQSVANALEINSGRGNPRKETEASVVGTGIFWHNNYRSTYLVRSIKQRRNFFTVWFSPTFAKGLELSVFEKPTGEARLFSQLPKELQERMEKAYKISNGGELP